MQIIKQWFWRLFPHKHVWTKPYEEPLPDGMGGTIHRKVKHCKLCGVVRAVNKRKGKQA